MSKRKGQQLKFEDRVKLQAYLEDKIPIKIISNRLKVSKQTIYREIKRNSIEKNGSHFTTKVDCVNVIRCKYKEQLTYTQKKHCYLYCEHYIKNICKHLARFPFVCNNCEKRTRCNLQHRYYYADKADKKAQTKLRDTRKGIKISPEDFQQIDQIVSPLVSEKHQSLNHILTEHKEIDVTERTLRNWINNGYMKAKNLDLPRVVRFKVKKEYTTRVAKPASILAGRMYTDYKEYIKSNPNKLIVQIDTVYGLRSDGKKILTIHFPSIRFQFGILLNSGSTDEVNSKLIELRKKIGNDLWQAIFSIILTDNGSEFNKLSEIEFDENGELMSRVFYCNPYCSSQKGSCERNHEFFRYIQPKKKSIQHFTQKTVDFIFSNINCIYRNSINGVRPYDLALTILGKRFLEAINIIEIRPDNVDLSRKPSKFI